MSNKHAKQLTWYREIIAPLHLKTGIEIGTHLGHNAIDILETGNVEHLTCLDPWADAPDDYILAEKYLTVRKKTLTQEQRYQAAMSNLKKFGNRVTFLRQGSLEAVNTFPDNSFDFVYIDGLHVYEYQDGNGSNADIKAWWPKVKPGGIFSGHDYYNGTNCGVYRAVNEFADRENIQINGKNGVCEVWWTTK